MWIYVFISFCLWPLEKHIYSHSSLAKKMQLYVLAKQKSKIHIYFNILIVPLYNILPTCLRFPDFRFGFSFGFQRERESWFSHISRMYFYISDKTIGELQKSSNIETLSEVKFWSSCMWISFGQCLGDYSLLIAVSFAYWKRSPFFWIL